MDFKKEGNDPKRRFNVEEDTKIDPEKRVNLPKDPSWFRTEPGLKPTSSFVQPDRMGVK